MNAQGDQIMTGIAEILKFIYSLMAETRSNCICMQFAKVGRHDNVVTSHR